MAICQCQLSPDDRFQKTTSGELTWHTSGLVHHAHRHEKGLASQRILACYESKVFWAEVLGSHNLESILQLDVLKPTIRPLAYVNNSFSLVTGLTAYAADSQVRTRSNNCAEGHPCPGICLLTGKDSFRCVCPFGYESFYNGYSCRGLPPFTYHPRSSQQQHPSTVSYVEILAPTSPFILYVKDASIFCVN